MQLNLEWHRSVEIGLFPYGVNLETIPKTPGVYIFLRLHGGTAKAIYVGKATDLRSRIKQQFNNLNLMRGIKEKLPNGQRRLVYAEFISRPGRPPKKALSLCEKVLIRYYLAQGHDLLNIQGAKLKFHELDSTRIDLKKFLPVSSKMLVG